MIRVLVPVLLLSLSVALLAQDAPPAFEVASIKINKTGQLNRLFRPEPGGRFNATNLRLRDLVQFAYPIPTHHRSSRRCRSRRV